MKKLELKQGLSYAMRGFSCVRGVPFDVADDIAEKLLSTGRFEELQGGINDETEYIPEKELSADDIAKLRKPELEKLAAEKNIDISGCANNDARVEKICGMLGLASMAQMGLED